MAINKSKKKIKALIKLTIPAGQANPAPPVGPALGQHGVPLMDFCNEFNKRTEGQKGDLVPVVLTVFEDRSFTFITKTPPASSLLLKAAGLKKGSAIPNRDKVGKISSKQLREIAEKKIADLNTNDVEAAMKIIEGTARNMGIEIENK